MKCPDCGYDDVRKHGAFYTCPRCGLSLKPWEIEKAIQRSKREIDALKDEDPRRAAEKKRRQRRKYRNWFEGRQEADELDE